MNIAWLSLMIKVFLKMSYLIMWLALRESGSGEVGVVENSLIVCFSGECLN